MEALQLHQALVAAGMPTSGAGTAKFIASLYHRLGISSSTAGGPQQQFFDILTHLLGEAPSLTSSWVADYIAACSALSSSNPEEAYILQPQSVLAWCQQSTSRLQQRVGGFLTSGPAAQADSVLELQQTAQSLLSTANAVHAVITSNSAEVMQLKVKLQELQQATKVLQVLEQLQQQLLGSPARPSPRSATWAGASTHNGTPAATSTSGSSSSGSFGQQPLFRPRNAACSDWQQQLSKRRAATGDGALFLDDLLHELQQQTRMPDGSPALAYPYQDVLTCVDTLFVNSSSSSSTSGISTSDKAWQAKLSVLLYYLLDGGWLRDAGLFAQGFQLPLTLVQQWQCHQLLDAAFGSAAGSKAHGDGEASTITGSSTAALDAACHLLVAIACPHTPFRFVEALLQVGRPATALAVQRVRGAGVAGGSSSSSSSSSSRSSSDSSLEEAEVLLRVQLGCGLLAEAFCDIRRHCNQVPSAERASHTNTLVRQLTDWALQPVPLPDSAAAAAAAQLQVQLQLQEQSAAVAAAGVVDGAGSSGRQQQLLQLPFNAAEEAVVVEVLRERLAAGKMGGHLLPLYLLQRGRSVEALNAYADYKASPAAAAAAAAAAGQPGAADSAPSRALLHKRLDAIMAAAAAALPPALQAAAAAAAGPAGASSGLRSVLQGLGSLEARQVQGGAGGRVELPQRGVEPPCFLAALLSTGARVGAAATNAGGAALAAAAAAAGTPAAASDRRGMLGHAAVRSGLSSGRMETGGSSRRQGAATVGEDGVVRPLLFEEEVMAEAGPGTVKLGSRDPAKDAGTSVVPLLFGTPAPAATAAPTAAATATAGRTPGIVRGGLFDTPAGGGVALWAKTPAAAAAAATGGGLMSEADFDRQVRFATPQVKGGGAAPGVATGGGVFTYTGQRSYKRMRRTPM